MVYYCPVCNTPLVLLQEYETEVVFFCTSCRKKVKAKVMSKELGMALNPMGELRHD